MDCWSTANADPPVDTKDHLTGKVGAVVSTYLGFEFNRVVNTGAKQDLVFTPSVPQRFAFAWNHEGVYDAATGHLASRAQSLTLGPVASAPCAGATTLSPTLVSSTTTVASTTQACTPFTYQPVTRPTVRRYARMYDFSRATRARGDHLYFYWTLIDASNVQMAMEADVAPNPGWFGGGPSSGTGMTNLDLWYAGFTGAASWTIVDC